MLDRTEQRIIGVLMEKELAVPDSYPMTENALLVGCNQKSNRDPEMSLEAFEVRGALMSLVEKEWVTKITGGRASRYRHDAAKRLGLGPQQKAVLAELLVRGPQAAGALKPRVARLGYHGTPAEIEAVLRELGERTGEALVEQLPKRPRERDHRWAHRLGPHDTSAPIETDAPTPRASPPATTAPSPLAHRQPPPPSATPGLDSHELELRVAQLESEIGALREEVAELRQRLDRGQSHAAGE